MAASSEERVSLRTWIAVLGSAGARYRRINERSPRLSWSRLSGDLDEPEPVRFTKFAFLQNSVLFAQALRAAHIPGDIHLFVHGVHGAGLATNIPEEQTWPGWLVRISGIGCQRGGLCGRAARLRPKKLLVLLRVWQVLTQTFIRSRRHLF
jgi:hypothetical protein